MRLPSVAPKATRACGVYTGYPNASTLTQAFSSLYSRTICSLANDLDRAPRLRTEASDPDLLASAAISARLHLSLFLSLSQAGRRVRLIKFLLWFISLSYNIFARWKASPFPATHISWPRPFNFSLRQGPHSQKDDLILKAFKKKNADHVALIESMHDTTAGERIELNKQKFKLATMKTAYVESLNKSFSHH